MMIPILAFALLVQAHGQQPAKHKISVQKYELPTYPPIARQAMVEGSVKLELKIDKAGVVTDAKVLSGHPMLNFQPSDVIKRWRFHCADCDPAQDYDHTIEFLYVLVKPNDCNLPGNTWYTFALPDRVTISATAPCVETAASQ